MKVAYRDAPNAAQRERNVDDEEVKRFADTANVRGGETWGNASGHSGTRKAWYAAGGVVAGCLMVAFGMTSGPRLLIWIGIGVAVIVGAIGMATHVWSDYEPGGDQDREAGSAQSDGSGGASNS